MELISVIVPVYKVERYLERCIQSILNQTYTDIEIILVDDGSPDGSPAICDRYAAQYKCIKVIHKPNGGLSSSRNAGIESSTGSFIAFVDSDDYIDCDFLSRLHECITRHEADLAMLRYKEVNDKSKVESVARKQEQIYVGAEETEKAFLDLKIDSVCVGLYRREAIGESRFIVGKTSEDIPFNFEVFRRIKKFVYIPEERYFYYYNSESISNGPLERNKLNYISFRKEIYEYYRDQNEQLSSKAEALYARAIMGLWTRMALYGISPELDEKQCCQDFKKEYREHKQAFYEDPNTPLSRKLLGMIIDHFYPIVRFGGRFIR